MSGSATFEFSSRSMPVKIPRPAPGIVDTARYSLHCSLVFDAADGGSTASGAAISDSRAAKEEG